MAKKLPPTYSNIHNWAWRRANKIYPNPVTVYDAAKWFDVPAKQIVEEVGRDGSCFYIVGADDVNAKEMYFEFDGE
jgi:hypothetical protein